VRKAKGQSLGASRRRQFDGRTARPGGSAADLPVTTEDAQVWQAPLEDALAGRRLGSASLEALHACIERMAHGLEAEPVGQQDGGECRCSF
jgi:hypothetical protein